MYEALFLNLHTTFEAFLEELFVGLLVSDRGFESSRADIVPRIQVRSFQVARDIVAGPRRPYRDWMPYDRTEEIADHLFRGGRPFSELSANEKATLQRTAAIRNAIAHQSRHALRKFEKSVISGVPLPSRERTPAGYLRGRFRVAPPQTRYENIAAELSAVARKLAT